MDFETMKQEYLSIKEKQEAAYKIWDEELIKCCEIKSIDKKYTEEEIAQAIKAGKLQIIWSSLLNEEEQKQKQINKYFKATKKKLDKLKAELQITESELYKMNSYEYEGKLYIK